MSLPDIASGRAAPFGTGASAAARGATSSVSMSRLYRQYCSEEDCRVNSALLDYILDRGDTCALTTLALRDNYLGPKGLRPVIRLLSDCQTLTSVDLGGNGASNGTVEYLCAVVEGHLSLSALSLRDSPVSAVGGRLLLALVEANPRIVAVDLRGSDILPALQERIALAADLNRLRGEQRSPQLVAADVHCQRKADGVTAEEARVRLEGLKTQKQSATLHPMQRAHSNSPPPYAATAPAPSSAALVPLGKAKAGGATVAGRAAMRAPAAVAAASVRLPQAQLEAIRAKYAERARVFTEVNGSDASRAAYEARLELMAMEANAQALPSSSPGAALPQLQLQLAARPKTSLSSSWTDQDEGDDHSGDVTEGTHASSAHETGPTPKPSRANAGGSASPLTSGRFPAHADTDYDDAVLRGDSVCDDGGGGSALLAAPVTEESTEPEGEGRAVAVPGRPAAVLVSQEEQFQLLFDEGCREYGHKNLDAAYVAWNEALAVATEKGNREWIAVVSTNLQRLGYELLVREGVDQLSLGGLREAAQSFALAMDVAVKARNAAWEAAMHKALKQVQSAVFHRSHAAAIKLFEEAVVQSRAAAAAAGRTGPRCASTLAGNNTSATHAPNNSSINTTHVHTAACANSNASGSCDGGAYTAVAGSVGATDSAHFMIPGTDIIVEHTAAFLAEWPVMLLVRDAVATWGECARTAAGISGATGAALRRTVDGALEDLAAFLAQQHFDTEMETEGLGWQGSSRHHYCECVLLSELWRELLAHVDQTLRHPLLGVIVALQLGNLYMASNQLPLAEQQFRQAVQASGQVLADPLLEATGALFSAMLCCQRAVYAEAERQILFAIGKCDEAVVGPVAATSGEPPFPVRAGGCSALNRAAVPAGYLATVKTSCEVLLVRTLVNTYRYREALERLEHALAYQYCDVLTDKLRTSFYSGALASLDEIAAISADLRSTLVYHLPTVRYQWDCDSNTFAVEESLCTWVVPQSSHMRFVEVAVTKDFGTTIGDLVAAVRAGLHLDPEIMIANADGERDEVGAVGGMSGIITTLHRSAWMRPLQTLHAIFMDPIVDFIQAMSPQMRSGSGLVTVVPAGSVWGVPFHALMSAKTERFLVELVAVQLCLSATQAAFASLSAQRVQQRDLYRDVVAVPREEVVPEVEANLSLLFPLDAHRARQEGEEMVRAMRETKDARARAVAAADPTATLTARGDLLVDDLEALEAALLRARTVHFTTAATFTPPLGVGSSVAAASGPRSGSSSTGSNSSSPSFRSGGVGAAAAAPSSSSGSGAALCIPISHKAVGLLSARQVSHLELFAELVVLSNSNLSLPHLARFSSQDHVINIARGFFSGGVPCVVAGLWCTPDMKPSALFAGFYAAMHDGGARRITARKPATSSSSGGPNVTTTATGNFRSGGTGSATGTEVEAEKEDRSRHKAVCLAQAIRALFVADPQLRYCPRKWAGYYCIGCDYM